MKQYLAVVGNNSGRIYDVETRRVRSDESPEDELDFISNIKLLWNSNNMLISHYKSITRKEARKYKRLLEEKSKIQSLIKRREEKSKLIKKLREIREINHRLIFPR